jgi:hypothetical protein
MSLPLFTSGFKPQIHVMDCASPGSLAEQQVHSCVEDMSRWMLDRFSIETNTEPKLHVAIRNEQNWNRPNDAYPLAHWQVGQIILPESAHPYFHRFFRPFLFHDISSDQVERLANDLHCSTTPETYDDFLTRFPQQGAYQHFMVDEVLTHEMGHHILYTTDVSRSISIPANEILDSWIKTSYKKTHYDQFDRLDWFFDVLMDSVAMLVGSKQEAILSTTDPKNIFSIIRVIWFGLQHEHDVARPFGYADPESIVKVINRLQQEIFDLNIPALPKEQRRQNAPSFPGEDIPISNKRFVELVAEALDKDVSELAGDPEKNLTLHTLYHS